MNAWRSTPGRWWERSAKALRWGSAQGVCGAGRGTGRRPVWLELVRERVGEVRVGIEQSAGLEKG